jgi:ABC-type multidrug transport system fused ATPase/permease subunit
MQHESTLLQVLLDGIDLREVDAAWYRRQMCVVSQDPRLFSESITYNITYGLEGA